MRPANVLRSATLVTAMLLIAVVELRAQHRVILRGQRFQPAQVVATVGDTMRFELESGAPHVAGGMRGELVVRARVP